jgi:methionine synthase II (cobalamin-independent)
MSAPTIRRAVQLLPSCATTGIGSLPHTQVELGLQAALALDIPFLPQLPVGRPGELMIPAALEGLPGLSFDEEGLCTVDLAAWEAGREAFKERLDAALTSGALEAWEPSPEACRAWRPFLWEVEHRKLAFAKAQLAGPFTVRSVARTSAGGPALHVPGLEQEMYRLVMARALAMVKALRRTGTTPLFFLDEPGLFAFERGNPQHLFAVQELKLLVLALQREGALVGVHCCGNTDWGALLDVQPDLLSLDVRLSLDAMVEEREALERFLASGATLSLGIIPTDLASTYEVDELVDSVEASLKAALPRGWSFPQVVSTVLLTPACGLAMRSVVDAERVLGELKRAQRRLREAMEAERPPPSPVPHPS